MAASARPEECAVRESLTYVAAAAFLLASTVIYPRCQRVEHAPFYTVCNRAAEEAAAQHLGRKVAWIADWRVSSPALAKREEEELAKLRAEIEQLRAKGCAGYP